MVIYQLNDKYLLYLVSYFKFTLNKNYKTRVGPLPALVILASKNIAK